MKLVYSDYYDLNLGNHVFPSSKYRLVKEKLLREGLARPEEFVEPLAAPEQDVALVHDREYIRKLQAGKLSLIEILRLEVPYSPELVRAVWLSAGGSILAGTFALEDSVAVNLGGGFHHAFADHGEGFCVLNDVAIAIRRLQKAGSIERAMTVDCDVHQGNGTAAIFARDDRVYTFSMHGERNYPWHKMTSSRDVGLPDKMQDDAYLALLAEHLPAVIEASRPDLAFYLAGVDPMSGDRFGRLSLSREGLHRRDRSVLEALRGAGIPLALLLSGGYAKTPQLTADLHAIAHREAARVYRSS